MFDPLDHLAFVPDDGASTQVDLLGEGALSHPSVDGGTTDADATDDL